MRKKRLPPKAIFHFMQVYYEVFGKIISYEQAEKEAHILIKLIKIAYDRNKIRTNKTKTNKDNSKI